MRWLAICLTAAGCGGLPPGPAARLRQPIVGGQADPGDPAVAALLVELPDAGGYLCTGALIAPQVLLTAAHCAGPVRGSARAEVVRAADAFGPVPAGLTHAVDDAVAHPDYDPSKHADWNDIGLVHLATPAPPPYLDPNTIPAERLGLEGRAVRFVGYGVTSASKGDDGQKRTVTKHDVRVASATEVTEGAAGGITCSGDSGGPSLLTLEDGREVVLAVTSRGDENCAQLGFDTRADAYLASFIAPYLAAQGQAPTCAADGRCAPGCSPPDPDCPCAADGQCTAACLHPEGDPDCPQSCLFDGGTCTPPPKAAPAPTPAPPPPPKSGCGCTSGPDAAGLLGLLALRGRRRRR